MTERVPLRRQPGGAYLYDLPGLTPYADAARADGRARRRRAARARCRTRSSSASTRRSSRSAPRRDEAAELPSRARRSRQRGIAVAETDRGGRATYHGPGQLVCYPVLDLADYGRDLRALRRRLEASVIGALAELGVAAEVRAGRRVRRRVDAGGREDRLDRRPCLALGHDARLRAQRVVRPRAVRAVSPCGHEGLAVTSVEQEIGRTVSRGEAQAVARRHARRGARRSGFEAVPVA